MIPMLATERGWPGFRLHPPGSPAMNINNLCYRVNEPDVTAEIFEDEVIAINLANGRYHSLRGAAAWLWQALAAGVGSRDVIAQLLKANALPPDAADQAAAVIEQLTAEELIVPAPEQRAEHPAGGPSGLAPLLVFLPPLIETFTDMENLLAIDPIHEVDVEGGWPHLPASADPS